MIGIQLGSIDYLLLIIYFAVVLGIGYAALNMKIARIFEPGQESPAGRGPVQVADHGRDVADIQIGRVSEHEELGDGRQKDDGQQPGVAPQLEIFFADDLKDFIHRRPPRLRPPAEIRTLNS